MSWLEHLFSTADLTPHGFCLYWRPDLLLMQLVPDALIGIAYYSIPLALAYFVWRRDDIAFGWIFWMFAAFILACGTTHWFEIWTLWHPDYAMQGTIKAVTAAISLSTAILLWPLLPRALALPSPAALRRVNAELSVQIEERNEAMMALQRETTERRQAEEALRQAQKMEGLGQLTGGVAHDFNNLLTILEGNLYILKDMVQGAGADRQIEAMERAIARGESLTRQLLTFARRQTLQPRAVDLREELPKIGELFKRSLRGDIGLTLDLAPDAWIVEVDPNELELALINIASNARDAMPSGGTLAIRVDNLTLAGGTEQFDGLAGDFLRIAINDTGEGIAPEIADRVFEPFFTTKEAGKGTGLGLSQVYGFARQSGGSARIAGTQPHGTTVTLLLPRSAAAPAKGGKESAAMERPLGGSVLLVEDNTEVGTVVADLMTKLGLAVKRAEDAEQAFALLGRDSFDLVVSDIVMPGGTNGVELARRIRKLFPEMAILLTTGYSAAAQEAAAEGFPILAKPFRAETLQHRITQLLRATSVAE